MVVKNRFGKALKTIRTINKHTQEDFSLVSSRTYISSLERELKSPTLEKVDLLAKALGVHPMTIITLSYCDLENKDSAYDLLDAVKKEVADIYTRKDTA
jgi:transcriptional regulator with XRE-family HTH domain